MNIQKQVKAAESARAFIANMTAAANGWSVSNVDGKCLLGEQIYVYAFDFQSQKAWMNSITLESFRSAIAKAYKSTSEWAGYRIALVELLEYLGKDASDPMDDDGDMNPTLATAHEFKNQNTLYQLISAFIGTTETALHPERLQADSHLIVMRYAGSDMEVPVRYFVVDANGMRGPLCHEDFMDVVREVVALDFEAHPEWFE